MSARLIASIAVAAATVCGCSSASGTMSTGTTSTGTTSTATTAAPPPPRAACEPNAARTLAASRAAAVYSLHGGVYGCSVKTGRETKLGSSTSCMMLAKLISRAAVTGSLAAYPVNQCGVDSGYTTIVVRDLRNGKQLASTTAIALSPGPESFSKVGSLVLTAGGAVAWIVTTNSLGTHRGSIEVDRLRAGKHTLLDSGAGIVAGSLKLSGSTVSWLHGSVTRTATL